jgi:hypothetical protein
MFEPLAVNIAKRHDLGVGMRLDVADVRAAHAAHADAGVIELAVGRERARLRGSGAATEKACGTQCRCGKKMTTVHVMLSIHLTLE